MNSNRRYYLHRRIKKFGGVKPSGSTKHLSGIIYVPHWLELTDYHLKYIQPLLALPAPSEEEE